jgi:hypothetical protein
MFIFSLIPSWLIFLVIGGICLWIWMIFNAASKNEKNKSENKAKEAKLWSAYQDALNSGDKQKALTSGRYYYLIKRSNRSLERMANDDLMSLVGKETYSFNDPKKDEIADEQKIQSDIIAMGSGNKNQES